VMRGHPLAQRFVLKRRGNQKCTGDIGHAEGKSQQPDERVPLEGR
jgi:hypothetical protein